MRWHLLLLFACRPPEPVDDTTEPPIDPRVDTMDTGESVVEPPVVYGTPTVRNLDDLFIDPVSRYRAAAAWMEGSRILVLGGLSLPGEGGSEFRGRREVDILDVDAGTLTRVASTEVGRGNAALIRMEDGRMLLTGGDTGPLYAPTVAAEIFDPVGETWTRLPDMQHARSRHISWQLGVGARAGDVVQFGNWLTPFTTEVYDGTRFQSMRLREVPAAAASGMVQVDDGRALLVVDPGHSSMGSELWIFDAKDRTCTQVGTLDRFWATPELTLLLDGTVLVSGGFDSAANVVERVDPRTGASYTVAARMLEGRRDHAAALLGSGRVVLAGGNGPTRLSIDSVEIFDPVKELFEPVDGTLVEGRGKPIGVSLPDGRVAIIGGIAEEPTRWFSVDLVEEAAL